MDRIPTVTEAIRNFLNLRLKDHNNPDLIRRWSPNLETQVNVIEGRPIEGLDKVYTDGSFTWSPIRIPKKAWSEPEWYDRQMTWPPELYAEGIGITGWNHVERVSSSVGYDFDSIVDKAAGVSEERIELVKQAAMALPYVEVRRSTGGKGIHLEAPLASFPALNHTEHAKLAKIILEKMSQDVGFDFASSIDKCGQVLWIWHRKMTSENGGLSLIKPAERILTDADLPSNWRDLIKTDSGAERSASGISASKRVIEAAQRYIARCRSVGHGSRNTSATSIAGHLAVFEGRQTRSRLNEDQIYRMLQGWNDRCDPPLDDSELRSCVQGGMYRGTPPERKWVDEEDDVDYDELIREASNLSPTATAQDKIPQPSEAVDTCRRFPVHCLPSPVAEYIDAAAKSITCDPSYIAMPLICSLARTITNKRMIHIKQDWCEPAIVWGVIVGLSGDGKSPAMREVGRFLKMRQAELLQQSNELLEQYEEAKKEYKARLSRWESEAKKATLEDKLSPIPKEPEEPTCERLYVSDTTTEALVLVLSRQREGLLLWRPELNGWIGSFGEFKKGKGANDQAHWLQFFDGDESYTLRKSDNAKGIYIRRASVNIFGGIQPGILAKLEDSHLKSGLVGRLLFAWPDDDPIGWSDAVIAPQLVSDMEAVFDRLFRLETPEEPIPVPLTAEARDLFRQYVLRNKAEVKELGSDLRAAYVKLKSYVARFALIFGMVKNEAEISVGSIRAAIELCDWFGGEARRVYTLFGHVDGRSDDLELLAWMLRNGKETTLGKLQASSRKWRGPGVAKAGLERLVQARVVEREGGAYKFAG